MHGQGWQSKEFAGDLAEGIREADMHHSPRGVIKSQS